MWRINLYHLALKVPKQYHVVMVVTMMITVLMTILRVVPGAGKNLLSKFDSYSPHWWVLFILVKLVKKITSPYLFCLQDDDPILTGGW